MSLPPLPIPVLQPSELIESATGVLGALYLKEQMQAYGQACRAAALEDAAQCAESAFRYAKDGYQIADEIRSLK